MPAMGSCYHCFKSDQDGPVWWYPANGVESQEWLVKEAGFGYKQKISYRTVAQRNEEANRNGNKAGELAGKIVFYKQADRNTNYSFIPDCPVLTITDGDKLYAKAFLPAPLSRIPIGQNNLPRDLTGERKQRGLSILTTKPRVIAIFLNIDGVPQQDQHFCILSSATEAEHQVENPETQLKPQLPKKAVQDSFLTYIVSREQDPYFFIHFPLIGTLNDTQFTTGSYGETLVRCFCEKLTTLQAGKHTISLHVFYWYDHLEFDVYALGEGSNTRGLWVKDFPNSKLDMSHPNPSELNSCHGPIASGSFIIDLPEPFLNQIGENLDRKPPPELYMGRDVVKLRKVARVSQANLSHVAGWGQGGTQNDNARLSQSCQPHLSLIPASYQHTNKDRKHLYIKDQNDESEA